jgi:2,4-dienoyl-CoA reductase-like NADH-dependent reductase (Old Yellow Enzyme family)
MSYKTLFSPIKIGNLEVKNRVVMAPMNTVLSQNNLGYMNDEILAYYAARARGGTGLIITECVLGTELASRFPYTSNLHLFNATHVPGLEELSETIHCFGSKVIMQLSIGFGRQGHSAHHESPPAPSAIPYQTDPTLMPKGMQEFLTANPVILDPRFKTMAYSDMPRAMTKEEIAHEIEEYSNSCILALIAGFDGIELHAPHGYLEHQFLSPRANKRTDEYGGSLKNRMRFLMEIYFTVRKKIGRAKPIGIRLSGDEHMPDGIHHNELKQIVKILGQVGIDYVHLSDGSYEALRYFFPDEDNLHLLEEAQSFKSVLPANVPVISVSIHNPATADQAIRDGKADMISLGRQMLADPEWANKAHEDKKYIKCLRCNDCLMRTAAGLAVRCRVNRNLGREKYETANWRPRRPNNVPIIPPIPSVEQINSIPSLEPYYAMED